MMNVEEFNRGRTCVLVMTLLFMAVCGFSLPSLSYGSAESAYQEARSRYYELINSSQTGEPTDWNICIELFRKVQSRYPKHKRAADAMFTEGLLYWNMHQRFGKQESLYSAIQAYERLIKRYPKNSLADDALYNVAIIYDEDLGDHQQASQSLETLIKSYPRSEMARQARTKLPNLEKSARSSAQKRPSTAKNTDSYLHVADTDKKQVAERVTSLLVQDIRFWSNPDYTRVSIYLSDATRYKHHLLKRDPKLKKPYRLFIDLFDAKLDRKLKRNIDIEDSLLERVRAGQFKPKVSRVVLDMNSVYDYEVRSQENPPRIIIDVQGKQPKRLTPASVIEAAEKQPRKKLVAAKNEGSARIKPKGSRTAMKRTAKQAQIDLNASLQRTVVIDPGHGGDDPGAKGPSGVLEKQVVLDIALELAKIMRKGKGYRVILTRKIDKTIPLQDRTRIANEVRGDIFVSIHANASRKRRASGVSTYIFDNATDEYSRRLEAAENASILRGEKEQPDFLSMMFKSMTKNYFTNQSVELAGAVQKSMLSSLRARYQKVRNLGVRQAQFYVLWNTEMPSVLVETSFISNRVEEKRLTSDQYQRRLAQGMARGIERFIKRRLNPAVAKR